MKYEKVHAHCVKKVFSNAWLSMSNIRHEHFPLIGPRTAGGICRFFLPFMKLKCHTKSKSETKTKQVKSRSSHNMHVESFLQ